MVHNEGRQPKTTRRWVLLADRMADRTITVGGILVIAAVLGMMLFLVYEALPLFKGGSVLSTTRYDLADKPDRVAGLTQDEYETVAVLASQDGRIRAWHLRSGHQIDVVAPDFQGKEVLSCAVSIDGLHMAFGFSDGTVRLGKIRFAADLLPERQLPEGLKRLDERDSTDGRAIYSLIPGGQVRKTTLDVELGESITVSDSGSPVVMMALRHADFGERPKSVLAALDGQGRPSLIVAESRLNLFTRKVTTKVSKANLPPLPGSADAVAYALVNDSGDEVFFAEKSGTVYRYDTRDLDKPVLTETSRLVPDGVALTALEFLLGDRSIVVGGSDGSVNIFFLLEREGCGSTDGRALVKTRTFQPHCASVSGLSPGQRGKTFATWDRQGEIWIRHGTSQKTILKLKRDESSSVIHALSLAPRLNGLLAVDGKGGGYWSLNIAHPETSLHTLFGKVWYEGYPAPSYTWQSTGATDAFEPKLSLIPLIFGTVKATFYSLLFAIPVALLAAVYTSEFLHSSVRAKVKPVMEIMASLPSVVLGFVAALVLAPVVETWIMSVILAFGVIPTALIASAYLWQLLPPQAALRLDGTPKFIVMFVLVGAGGYVAYLFGPGIEALLFGGNFKTWLSADAGTAAPLLFMLLIPAVAIAVSVTAARLFGRRLNLHLRLLRVPYSGLLDMGRWLVVAAVTVVVSYALALLLDALGLDPRHGLVGSYQQRNTLVVGFAMGFAVIPIIYTLAEDALSSVPEHLRSASLGCGATHWQTAIWIVLPTAISGVFSAAMIGMGRAVGETMIVVMSAGNTPLIDVNIFNGLRALSANIAVELPEAPKDGTLYRVLFLTGLVLFGMTFVINTIAELVRIRFRKRAMQL